MAGHVVTAPAVQVIVGGRSFFLERGALLPAETAKDTLDRLVTDGLIEALPEPEPEVVDPPKAPAGNAGLDKWVEHAKSLGIEVPADADKDAVKALVAAHVAA